MSMKFDCSVYFKLPLANIPPEELLNCLMKQKINDILTNRVLGCNGGLKLNESLSFPENVQIIPNVFQNVTLLSNLSKLEKIV